MAVKGMLTVSPASASIGEPASIESATEQIGPLSCARTVPVELSRDSASDKLNSMKQAKVMDIVILEVEMLAMFTPVSLSPAGRLARY